ncbi:hypothetical protein IBX65_03765 [Candidatus Aerophobetes bacterium]|nr:hypothetical protein [Candidatus Aerophobetes bacterium]
MKKLLYVPMIHMEADLGSLAPTFNQRCIQIYGEERWEKHKRVVSKFWDCIATFFDGLDASNLKIYQDGLVEDGKLGQKIVEEAAKKGSKNHQIILNLMQKGANIVKTEDLSLVKKEYDTLMKLAGEKHFLQRTVRYIQYKLLKASLMQKRDRFIAQRIHKTLKEEELGVLFIGVYHDILSRISKDIKVYEVKEKTKIKAYFDGLIREKDEKKFDELAEYLILPVEDLKL